MSALVDTSVLAGAVADAALLPADRWAVSVVNVGELHAGVLLANAGAQQAARLRRLSTVLSEAPVLDIDRRVAGCYGELRAVSGRMPTNDVWIPRRRSRTISRSSPPTSGRRTLPLARTRRVGAEG